MVFFIFTFFLLILAGGPFLIIFLGLIFTPWPFESWDDINQIKKGGLR